MNNTNLNCFGIKSSNKMIVHNIILPENCFNSSHFIDNIFGYNQYNENNIVDSFNIFNWESYEKLFKKIYKRRNSRR